MKTLLRLLIALCSLFISSEQFHSLLLSDTSTLFMQIIFEPVDLLIIGFGFLIGMILCAATWKKVVHYFKSMIKDKKNKLLFILIEVFCLVGIYLYIISIEFWFGALVLLLSALYGISTGITTSYSEHHKPLQRSKHH
ncbi:hypothetical protein [Bacillus taeanensis]|uniref:Uncharacterized protein n=1 Tax=Bacillus taeanensis TaxID=273032 RepID=A0A366XXE6_9BACI|nr:hypothetical protein [Bacillus taeanensis]RBW70316.1 hypothetical protein DS031_07030 [Bacillus taeanensis]